MPTSLPVTEIAARFNLGTSVSGPEPVAGGASHGLYRLETSQGTWAIKQLTRQKEAWWVEAFENSVRLELTAASAGIECAKPILPSDPVMHVVAEFASPDGDLLSIRVHEWVDGEMATAPAEKSIATWLGRTIASLGKLGIPSNKTMRAVARTHPEIEWADWIAQAESKGLSIGTRLRRATAVVADANGVVEALRGDDTALVVLHRDVRPSNVLVNRGGPHLIDWDSAGPDDPWLDLIQTAVRFSGGLDNAMDETTFRLIIESYRLHGGEMGANDQSAFAGVIRANLESLSYFLWRALGHRGGTNQDQIAAEQTAQLCLDELEIAMRSFNAWTKLLMTVTSS